MYFGDTESIQVVKNVFLKKKRKIDIQNGHQSMNSLLILSFI